MVYRKLGTSKLQKKKLSTSAERSLISLVISPSNGQPNRTVPSDTELDTEPALSYRLYII